MDLDSAKQQMLRQQLRRRGIHDPGVLDAMARLPREQFIAGELRGEAYSDRALPIACGQTISQPYIVGLMSQALELTGQETVLEIGTGSGYQTAILAELAREVISVERYGDLSQQAGQLLSALGYDNIRLIVGDGTLGYAPRAPYDRIIVTAAATECPPALLQQLGEEGILVIPVGAFEHQLLQAMRRHEGQMRIATLAACRFVPLIGGEAAQEGERAREEGDGTLEGGNRLDQSP